MQTFIYRAAWTELRLSAWHLIPFPLDYLAQINKWLMSQETHSRQLLLLFILSGYWLFSTPHFLLSQRSIHSFKSFPSHFPLLLAATSADFALMVRFAPHLICNSSISCGSECTFKKKWKNMLWNADFFSTVTNSAQQRLFSCFAGRLAQHCSPVSGNKNVFIIMLSIL